MVHFALYQWLTCQISTTEKYTNTFFRLSDEDIEVIDRGIQRFVAGYKAYFPTVPPKVHILEDHVVDQLKLFKMGLGCFNEQGGESAHKLIKGVAERFGSTKNPENIRRALERCTLNYLA